MKELLNELSKRNFTTLRYEVLSQLKAGKAVIRDAVNHWEPLGFLDGIKDETKKEQIAVAYDNMANDLLFENERVVKIDNRINYNCRQDDKDKQGVEFDVIVFPMIRRIVCKIDNFNYDDFLGYLEKFSFLAINYDGYDFKCDIEAEFCALLSLIIEEMFKNSKK